MTLTQLRYLVTLDWRSALRVAGASEHLLIVLAEYAAENQR